MRGYPMYYYMARDNDLGFFDDAVENSVWTPDVPGIGPVQQVHRIRRPWRELQEIHCKWKPGGRANHVGLFFNEKFFVMGGRDAPGSYRQDMWYRDDRLPKSLITKAPRDKTFDNEFRVVVDKDGCVQECLMWDRAETMEMRRWNRFENKMFLTWLDKWTEGGPGTGKYLFYARSIDPAGNVDPTFDEDRYNMFRWDYSEEPPWMIIMYSILGFLIGCWGVYMEFRRRKRKAAMQRYAIKRMRRKFKASQKEADTGGGVDWKSMMDDNNDGGGHGKKKKKKKKKKDKVVYDRTRQPIHPQIHARARPQTHTHTHTPGRQVKEGQNGWKGE